MIRRLTSEMIDQVFARAETQEQYITGIYALAVPDFDDVEQVGQFPKVHRTTWEEICRKAVAWDQEHFKPDHMGQRKCMPGGAWLNYGFSGDDTLRPWEVFVDLSRVRYKTPQAVTPRVAV